MTDSLTARLLARPVGPVVAKRAPKIDDFTRELELSGNTLTATLNDKIGVVNEGTARLYLEEEGQNPDDWEVIAFRKIKYGQGLESVKFSFKRKAVVKAGLELPDLDDLHEAVKRSAATSDYARPYSPLVTAVTCLADLQIGKVQERGGLTELLTRVEVSRQLWAEAMRRLEPEEIILGDNGDAIENFENVASQERTNDAQLTEQLRAWRRIFWTWIDTAAQLAPVVRVLSVPSNHCQVRKGKAVLGPPSDDYGVEVLTQVADMASVSPEKYGHVSFYTPQGASESVVLEAAGGKVLGFAHGHQVTRPENLHTWLAGQALGRTQIGGADIAVFGHWHHLRIQAVGDDRWIFIAPTSDNGSDWYRNLSGNNAAPGVMSFVVDQHGWRDLAIH